MSGYGSTKKSDGTELNADGKAPALTGEKVVGNEILSFDFAKDKETGEPVYTRAELKLKQSNGAIVNIAFFDSSEGWAIDKTNAQMLHIWSKVVSKEEYYAAIGTPSSFQDFITKIKDNVLPKAKGMKFTCKLVYNVSKTTGKSNLGFPNFPNFFEKDGTSPSTISPTNPKYDIYVRPEASNVTENTNSATTEDVPF